MQVICFEGGPGEVVIFLYKRWDASYLFWTWVRISTCTSPNIVCCCSCCYTLTVACCKVALRAFSIWLQEFCSSCQLPGFQIGCKNFVPLSSPRLQVFSSPRPSSRLQEFCYIFTNVLSQAFKWLWQAAECNNTQFSTHSSGSNSRVAIYGQLAEGPRKRRGGF